MKSACFLKESKSFIIIIMTLKEKCSASSLSDPQSHIESVFILLWYKSKFKLLQPFRERAGKAVNCLLPGAKYFGNGIVEK